MKTAELDALVREMERIAKDAGALVMGGYRRGTQIQKKGAIDLVTEFDLASEALIVRELARVCPNIEIVGEEGQGKRAIASDYQGYRFFVDPIDGTTNFAHGHPFFCVSLGLCRGGAPIAGVIFAPALDVCWCAVVGQGALRNGEACRVSEQPALSEALCATGFGYDVVGAHEDNIAEFAGVQKRSRGVRRCGSAALDLALVADGTFDAYWEFLLQPWDLAAGAAIVIAAGGQATGFDGTPVDAQKGAVVASNGRVHTELLTLIDKIREGRPVPVR